MVQYEVNRNAMKYVDVMKYCLSLPDAARKPLNAEGNAFAFTVGESVFGHFATGAPIQWRLSLRVTLQNFEALPSPPRIRQAQDQFNTDHDDYWITITRVENFDDDQLKALIDWSYQRAQQAVISCDEIETV